MARVRAMARVRVRVRVRVYGRTVGAALVDGELHVHGARRGTQQEDVVGEQLLDLGRDASPIVLDETVALGLAAPLPRLALEPAADHVAELLERLLGWKTRTSYRGATGRNGGVLTLTLILTVTRAAREARLSCAHGRARTRAVG